MRYTWCVCRWHRHACSQHMSAPRHALVSHCAQRTVLCHLHLDFLKRISYSYIQIIRNCTLFRHLAFFRMRMYASVSPKVYMRWPCGPLTRHTRVSTRWPCGPLTRHTRVCHILFISLPNKLSLPRHLPYWEDFCIFKSLLNVVCDLPIKKEEKRRGNAYPLGGRKLIPVRFSWGRIVSWLTTT
jgi:hypothetical protein